MRGFFSIFFCLIGLSLFAQNPAAQLAPGVQEQYEALLNKPAMVEPVGVTALGRSWFKLTTDAHVLTGDVGFEQVAAILLDIKNTTANFNGKKSKLSADIISQTDDETLVDFTAISIGPLGIRIKTPYRASVKKTERTESKLVIEIKQLAEDSAANKEIKNISVVRYAEEITIAGKKYTYIRISSLNDVNTYILSGGSKGIMENAAILSSIEALELVIAAAKKR